MIYLAWKFIATRTGDYTLTQLGYCVKCNPTGGAFAVTLPDPSAVAANDGRMVWVKNVSASTNNITVQSAGSKNIDGASTYVINTARGGAVFVWDSIGGEWVVFEA